MAKKKKQIEEKTNYIQLELIPPTEVEKLYKEFEEVKESSGKVRRSIFAKHTELSKKIQDLTCQIESLQKQLIVMNEWIITQLGAVIIAQSLPEDTHEITSLHITPINVTYADKLHRSQSQEISDIQILTA